MPRCSQARETCGPAADCIGVCPPLVRHASIVVIWAGRVCAKAVAKKGAASGPLLGGSHGRPEDGHGSALASAPAGDGAPHRPVVCTFGLAGFHAGARMPALSLPGRRQVPSPRRVGRLVTETSKGNSGQHHRNDDAKTKINRSRRRYTKGQYSVADLRATTSIGFHQRPAPASATQAVAHR